MNITFKTTGDLTKKGDNFLITAYISEWNDEFDIDFGLFLSRMSFMKTLPSYLSLSNNKKKELLNTISKKGKDNFSISYLYFDKRNITNYRIFDNAQELKKQLFQCFIQNIFALNPKSNNELYIRPIDKEDVTFLENNFTDIKGEQGQKITNVSLHSKFGTTRETEKYLALIVEIVEKQQKGKKTDLYELVPFQQSILINATSFDKKGNLTSTLIQ